MGLRVGWGPVAEPLSSKPGGRPARKRAAMRRWRPPPRHPSKAAAHDAACLHAVPACLSACLPACLQIETGNMAGMVSIRDVIHVMLKEHRWAVGVGGWVGAWLPGWLWCICGWVGGWVGGWLWRITRRWA